MPWNDGLAGVALSIAQTNATSLRVMAGPGTGKSFAMKRRVARLLEEGVQASRILAVTFTRNAAASLVQDLHALGIQGSEQIRAGTLHAFCFSLLHRQHVFAYLNRAARPVLSFSASGVLQYEAGVMLDDLVEVGNFGTKRDCTKRIRAFEAAWARLQSQMPGWPADPIDRAFHTALAGWLQFHRGMLIGELVPEALRFLRHNPTSPVLHDYDHVIVDEYQDLNRAEQDLVDLLASHGATAIVGDVDQSIYRFRHANPEGIVNFSQLRADTHDETLMECRRCPLSVVRIADHLVGHNHTPTSPPRLRPTAGNPEGRIDIVQWNSMSEEAAGVADHVAWLINQHGYAPGEILVLTPRRILGYEIRDQLAERDVPVHSFYHEEALEGDTAQRALAVLTLMVDNEDRIALRWWLGHGSPSSRKGSYARLRSHCEANDLSPWAALQALQQGTLAIPHTSVLVEQFAELQMLIVQLSAQSLAAIIDALLPAEDLSCASLREAAVLVRDDVEDVAALTEALKTFVSQPEMPQEGNFVRVMSLHKSKGLTARVALIAGCVQGLIPFEGDASSEIERDAILKEQRRLFYVAVTRCTERLVISSFARIARNVAYKIGAKLPRGLSPNPRTIASTFLAELGPAAPATRVGSEWRDAGFM